MEWIKSMGKRLMMGSLNLINTPFPVVMFEPRSYLEKLADVWVYPTYLNKAASTTDPLERLKLVITWFVAGACVGGAVLGINVGGATCGPQSCDVTCCCCCCCRPAPWV